MPKKKHIKHIEEMTREEWKRRLKEYHETLTLGNPNGVRVDPRYTERHEGATPLGGDYSIAYYYDAERNPCVKAKAKYVNIVVYDKDGRRINEVYGNLG